MLQFLCVSFICVSDLSQIKAVDSSLIKVNLGMSEKPSERMESNQLKTFESPDIWGLAVFELIYRILVLGSKLKT